MGGMVTDIVREWGESVTDLRVLNLPSNWAQGLYSAVLPSILIIHVIYILWKLGYIL